MMVVTAMTMAMMVVMMAIAAEARSAGSGDRGSCRDGRLGLSYARLSDSRICSCLHSLSKCSSFDRSRLTRCRLRRNHCLRRNHRLLCRGHKGAGR